jgi:hypothetical protein
MIENAKDIFLCRSSVQSDAKSVTDVTVAYAAEANTPVTQHDFFKFSFKSADFLKSLSRKTETTLPSRPLLTLNYYANLSKVLADRNENWLQLDDMKGKRNRSVLKSLVHAVESIATGSTSDSEKIANACNEIICRPLLTHKEESVETNLDGITAEAPDVTMRDLMNVDPSQPIDAGLSALIDTAIGDLLKTIDSDPRFQSAVVAKDVVRRIKIVLKGERYQAEISRPVDQQAGLEWLRGRDVARTKSKTGLKRYLKRGEPQGTVEQQPTRSKAYDCVMRDFRRAVDPENVLRSKSKRDQGTHMQEGLHAVGGRLVSLAGWAAGTAVSAMSEKFFMHQAIGSAITPFVTASGRILTDTSKTLTRKYNPVLPSTVRSAPECSAVAKEYRAALVKHQRNVRAAEALVTQDFSLDGVAQDMQKEAYDSRLANINKCLHDLDVSSAELKKIDRQYRLSTAHGRFQHYGKGAGAVVDTVSSAVMTPLTIAAPKIGIPLQGAVAVGRLAAGYLDDKSAVRASGRMAMKYAEILPPELRDVPLTNLDAAQIPARMLRAQATGRTQERVGVVMSVMKKRLAQLHDAKESLEKIKKPSPSQQGKLGKINSKIERLGLDWERLLEPMRWHEIDPHGLAGKLLRKQFFAWRQSVREHFSRPGALFSQALQRYAGNFHAFVSASEALIVSDMLTAIYDDGHFHAMPEPVQTGDLAGTAAGGTVVGGTAGVVRHEKQFTRAIFTPPVPNDQRWIVPTPNHTPIDLTNTGVDHQRRYTFKRRLGMVGVSSGRAMVSGPVSLWNLANAAYQRKLARKAEKETPALQRKLITVKADAVDKFIDAQLTP